MATTPYLTYVDSLSEYMDEYVHSYHEATDKDVWGVNHQKVLHDDINSGKLIHAAVKYIAWRSAEKRIKTKPTDFYRPGPQLIINTYQPENSRTGWRNMSKQPLGNFLHLLNDYIPELKEVKFNRLAVVAKDKNWLSSVHGIKVAYAYVIHFKHREKGNFKFIHQWMVIYETDIGMIMACSSTVDNAVLRWCSDMVVFRDTDIIFDALCKHEPVPAIRETPRELWVDALTGFTARESNVELNVWNFEIPARGGETVPRFEIIIRRVFYGEVEFAVEELIDGISVSVEYYEKSNHVVRALALNIAKY